MGEGFPGPPPTLKPKLIGGNLEVPRVSFWCSAPFKQHFFQHSAILRWIITLWR